MARWRRKLPMGWIANAVVAIACTGCWIWSYRAAPYLILSHWRIGDTTSFGRFATVELYRGGVGLNYHTQEHAYTAERGKVIKAEAGDAGGWGSAQRSDDAPRSETLYVGANTLKPGLGFAKLSTVDTLPLPAGDTIILRLRQVCIPFWAITAACALPLLNHLLMMPLRRRRLRRLRSAGLCVRCGYDLRGSPGRCPECGTQVSDAPLSA